MNLVYYILFMGPLTQFEYDYKGTSGFRLESITVGSLIRYQQHKIVFFRLQNSNAQLNKHIFISEKSRDFLICHVHSLGVRAHRFGTDTDDGYRGHH